MPDEDGAQAEADIEARPAHRPQDQRAEGENNPSKASVLWEDAAKEYTGVVEVNKDPKLVKEAAYAAVLAWKNALAVDPTTARPTSTRRSRVGVR
ncbi:MAG: hypothetical protein HC809_15800, partial [Gammaproteobacteria bacterium]|nr:hypothetical protein [Gammaproteobacteria bacterium]